MDKPIVNLLQQAEPMASLSISHLTPESRQKLAKDELSVLAHPNEYGGFVYVGVQGVTLPDEADLRRIFELAIRAELAWLKFDADAVVIDGLPVFDDEDEPTTD